MIVPCNIVYDRYNESHIYKRGVHISMRQLRYLSLVGAVLLFVIPIIPIVSFLLLLVHTMTKDPEAVGYVVMFLTIPILMFAGFSSATAVTSWLFLKKSFAKEKQQRIIWHLMISGVNLILAPIYLYAVNFILELTLSTTGMLANFLPLSQSNIFHPTKLLYGFYFIGPILIMLGGLLSYMNQESEE